MQQALVKTFLRLSPAYLMHKTYSQRHLIGAPAAGVERPIDCSEPLVETKMIRAERGVLIPLVNWSAGPVKGLTVTVSVNVPTADVTLASGKRVRVSTADADKCAFTFDLDIADALILR